MSVNQGWKIVFRLGLIGLTTVVIASLLKVFSFSVGVQDGPISEGSELLKSITLVGFWTFILMGLILVLPTIAYLRRWEGKTIQVRRIVWAVLIVLFPFITPYVFFALVVQQQTSA